MAFSTPDCPGSWLPLPAASPGDPVTCALCGRRLHATPPPLDLTPDPWRGTREARVQPHWPAGFLKPSPRGS